MKKIFLKDIAAELNLSKTAVSLVLNNRGDENKISKETQKRILDFARENNYRPNQMARGLSLGKSETIGLIVPNISDIFYARIAHHVELRAKKLGYNVVFSSSNEDAEMEKELMYSMLNRQVDGLIIASTQKNKDEILKLKRANFPFVLIDRHYPDIKTNYVIVDNFNGAKKMTQHLLRNRRGSIGLITIKSGLDAILQRRLGYETALMDEGIKIDTGIIKELDPFAYKSEMKGAIKDMVSGLTGVDAIVFTTHYLTASGLRELKLLDVKVPSEVAIISFDELGAFDLVDPPISTSKQPVDDIGNLAVEILVNDIEKKNIKIENQSILQTQLLIRKSCGV
ncbi:LacI family DNA-binding transcriptional regulator [Ulvibacterium marinum]|uniref:LacI family DNA-binding transcriptional regulator n=1 Tax=Ulvibacterium marinum TaxID=2419782 RepID=UPI002494A997|nr:LacI family DNA-binding transcriptional regulator [Ulvibacterium marinum]